MLYISNISIINTFKLIKNHLFLALLFEVIAAIFGIVPLLVFLAEAIQYCFSIWIATM